MAIRGNEDLYERAIGDLIEGQRIGRPIVPLVGAGISIEAGVPPLSEVTRYLAKTKAYLRYRVYQNLVPQNTGRQKLARELSESDLPSPLTKPWDFLREFGWPDPQELNSDLWHWLWRHPLPTRKKDGVEFLDAMDLLINSEILESLGRLERNLVNTVRRPLQMLRNPPSEDVLKAINSLLNGEAFKVLSGEERNLLRQPLKTLRVQWEELLQENRDWRLLGDYWKILLIHMTRSSPELIDTLFRRLTRRREPFTSHRFLAFLAPVLRLRLFLTTNFDTLLEDALRIEGFRPTVYEVTDGHSLPHAKLLQEELAVVKLHGGAYGLLVGDKLDSPLDEETRSRLKAYLPENLILLVMGLGGWDLRVLDMVELVINERRGDVWWLRFEPELPEPLQERFTREVNTRKNASVGTFHTAQVLDPGAFLRELYSRIKRSHPSSSRAFAACDLRPVLARQQERKNLAGAVHTWFNERLVFYVDSSEDYGLGASLRLARFVAAKAKTHLPVWIDLETKFTVEDVLVELIQQLRRYDPGLPPEILAMEISTAQPGNAEDWSGGFGKVVRRLYAALARGRYILAFNGVQSFGRKPTRHHTPKEPKMPEEIKAFDEFQTFLKKLISGIEPTDPEIVAGKGIAYPESLGLLNSILAFSLDWRDHSGEEALGSILPSNIHWKNREINPLARTEGEGEVGVTREQLVRDEVLTPNAWIQNPSFVLLTAIRRRRSYVALHELLPKYLCLADGVEPRRAAKKLAEFKAGKSKVEEEIKRLEKVNFIRGLNGGDYWMSRRLRNDIYDEVRAARKDRENDEIRIRALATLAFVHKDLADYHHLDLYVGTQNVDDFLEELYHRNAALRYLNQLCDESRSEVIQEISPWLRFLAEPISRQRMIRDQKESELPSLANLRFLWLRALHDVLEQEREVLRDRVPSVTLQHWMRKLREDLDNLARTGKDLDEDARAELRKLRFLLEDIQVEVLRDRFRSREIINICRARIFPGEVGEEIVDNIDWLADPIGRASTVRQVEKLWNENRDDNRSRAGNALLNAARAFLYSPWLSTLSNDIVSEVEIILARLLEGRGHSKEVEGIRVGCQRLIADHRLWEIWPWSVRSENVERHLDALRSQDEAADEAQAASEKSLEILDTIREEDRTERSYFYSLKGCAFYIRFEFIEAYRYLDLAMGGISEVTPKEREALAVTLLRRAECHMLHSNATFGERIEKLHGFKTFARCLSTKIKDVVSGGQAERDARKLLCLSLLNWNQRMVRSAEADPGRENQLGIMRSRLAVARDILDRVEGLLEHSRRNVEWWAFLFQLRAQLSVERILLLISGDLLPLTVNSDKPASHSWGSDSRLQRRFIHMFQDLLRQGLMAVRQGLDIVLPSKDRQAPRLEKDVLLGRLLRSWTELMVCGAFATEISFKKLDRASVIA